MKLHDIGSIWHDLDAESNGGNMAGIEWSLPFGAMIRTVFTGPSIILFSHDHVL